ncbi:MAG TPA: mandelate racemase/muconate lactonizing enzyme family protein [Chloroflexota bacterium]|nr:mandelate racemase/muconate lactonizing enzyme family protein [Chloroflexota bacterium]
MRIVDVKAYPLRVETAKPVGSALSMGRERSACLVEVITDEGLIGWGEAGAGRSQEVLAAVVERQFRPMLLGEDPTDLNRLWDKMYSSLMVGGRTAGLSVQALSGIDIALWDLWGKSTGLPVYRLLGGKVRDSVLAYATAFYYHGGPDETEGVEEEALRYVERGFRAVKMKIGGEHPSVDVRRIRIVRKAIGPDRHLMLDANQAFTVAGALDLARRITEYDISWLEEPLPAHDLQGYLQLRQGIGMPVAAGECLYTRFGFRDWCAQRAVDIVQPDLCNAGGITECMRIASLTGAWDMLCNPHAWGTPVALAATIHLAVALPQVGHTRLQLPLVHSPALECDQGENPLRDELAPLPFTFRDGFLTPTDGPGLGVDVDRVALKRFLVA